MKKTFSFAYTDNGQLEMRVAGKFTGHTARDGLELLQAVVEEGGKEIVLDLRETTSVDSLGIRVFDWIREQNGSLSVDIIPPVKGVSDDELAHIELAAS
ncbi:MAG: hypothetical protein E3J72_10110 [Planctomycetota bacterium]|nr:MAG: hypothetical protein E3J72_10110 [Planctomycetota bacterium]